MIAIGLSFLLATGAAADGSSAHDRNPRPKPTIVLVHGAFADAASWTGEIEKLQDDGFTVIAPANPLRGPIEDSQYVASVLDTLSGPLVLVGHSYGGVVITNAAAMTQHAQNVKSLVYVAAFIPDVGEAVGNLSPLPGSLLGPTTTLVRPCPGTACADVYVDPNDFAR
jgi:pimeloyl-ACP methyl ester carboxylesterase